MRSLLLLVSLFISPKVFTQQLAAGFPFSQVGYFNTEQGLFGYDVYWMIQDRQGFLWFITDLALNKYDGYTVRNYSYKPEEVNTIFSGAYYTLREDENGLIWMGSYNHSIYSFDPRTEKFRQYKHDSQDKSSIASNHVNALEPDGEGNVWIATADHGLDKLEIQSGRFTHFPHVKDNASTVSDDNVYSMALGDDPRTGKKDVLLWIITNNLDVECVDRRTGKVMAHYGNPYGKKLFNWKESGYMCVDGIKHGMMWLGMNDNGFFGFHTDTRNFEFIPLKRHCKSAQHLEGVYHVLQDNKGNLWSTTDDAEIVYYDRESGQCYYQPVAPAINFLTNPAILFEDRSGKIWICSDNGLVTVDTHQKDFFHCGHEAGNDKTIASDLVLWFRRPPGGPLLVNSDALLQTYDPATRAFSPLSIMLDEKNVNQVASWGPFSCVTGNKVWLNGRGGIVAYDVQSATARLYPFHNPALSVGGFGSDGTVIDSNGTLWTSGRMGLMSIDTASGRITWMPPATLASANGFVPFLVSSDNKVYGGGWATGFVRFDPKTRQVKAFRHDTRNPASVSNESCLSYMEDRHGYIWFATLGGGINVFNPATEQFRSFDKDDGLASNYVVSLVEDKNGNYWAGTRGGISKFRPPVNPFDPACKISFRNYDRGDGLPTNALNLQAAWCDADGMLYFGTRTSGIFSFDPSRLEDSPFLPQVTITDFRLMNHLVSISDSGSVLKVPVQFTKEIHLTYKQNTVSFTFAAHNYIHPEKNQYAYMLEGFDKDWIASGSDRTAGYTNLDPGEYVFKVKGSNNDGVWNPVPASVRLVIAPPFWKTIWFRLIFISAVILLVYGFYRYRLGQILLLQKIRNKIAHDLHDDIGSTLNSISVFSEVAKQDEKKRMQALEMIGDSSRKVIDSMSDIVWSINPENDNFENIIMRMRSIAYNLFKAKNIQFSFKADEMLHSLKLSMQDRRNFYLVFKEAINNIIKYSQASKTSIELSKHHNQVVLLIHDNGVGFDPRTATYGNGINSMRKRAEEMKGHIVIESEKGNGTFVQLKFTV